MADPGLSAESVDVKLFGSILCAAALSWAQANTTVYNPRDINGHRVEWRDYENSAKGEETQILRNLNGRQIPYIDVSEKVLSRSAKGAVTEKITKKYDPNGALTQTERIVTEITEKPGGGQLVKETTYRSVLNGTMQEYERRTSDMTVRGQSRQTNVTVERPGPNGPFAVYEKRNILTNGPDSNQETTESISRADGNGRFQERVRTVTKSVKTGAQSIVDTTDYELDVNHRPVFHDRTVTTTTKQGQAEVIQSDLYAPSIPGQAVSASARMELREEQILERTPGPGGKVTQSFNVRRPTISDPGRLGPIQKVLQSVCSGKCTGADVPIPPSAVIATVPGQPVEIPGQSQQGQAQQGQTQAAGQQKGAPNQGKQAPSAEAAKEAPAAPAAPSGPKITRITP